VEIQRLHVIITLGRDQVTLERLSLMLLLEIPGVPPTIAEEERVNQMTAWRIDVLWTLK
jgi:hypothetical protein